jgi:hypothetical protein
MQREQAFGLVVRDQILNPAQGGQYRVAPTGDGWAPYWISPEGHRQRISEGLIRAAWGLPYAEERLEAELAEWL